MPRRHRDLARHVALFRPGRTEQLLLYDLGKAQYRIQRRAQFMHQLPDRIGGQARDGHGFGTRFGGDFVEIGPPRLPAIALERSEEHTSELQSLMRISYADFCLKKKNHTPDKPDSSTYTKST